MLLFMFIGLVIKISLQRTIFRKTEVDIFHHFYAFLELITPFLFHQAEKTSIEQTDMSLKSRKTRSITNQIVIHVLLLLNKGDTLLKL